LASQFPDALVERVVEETGRRERRSRNLPAALIVRYVLALALFPSDGYDEVMRQLKLADEWLADGGGAVKIPATTAITSARDRLGVEPVKLLFTPYCAGRLPPCVKVQPTRRPPHTTHPFPSKMPIDKHLVPRT
jgi:hypothetical protein